MANSTVQTKITALKMKFSIKDFFSKCDQIRRILKKSLMENFIFCAVWTSIVAALEKLNFPGYPFKTMPVLI